MALPTFTMRQLLEAGVHFGHQKRRWNPDMAPYLFGARNNIHIIDLQQTVPLLYNALRVVRDIVSSGGRVLFVSTKRQGSETVAESAKRCGQYYVNHRWLGGTLTNWKTISNSIKRLRELDEQLGQEEQGLTKRELLQLTRHRDKLERSLGGIREMGGLPDIMFVIDTNKEAIAVNEAKVLNIPVVAIIDSNSDPHGIDFPIPGNDDALRAITLYCDLMARAVLDGIQTEMAQSGEDMGAAETVPDEALPAVEAPPAESGDAATAPAPAEATADTAADAPAEATAETAADTPAEATAETAAPEKAQSAAPESAEASEKTAPPTAAEAIPENDDKKPDN